MNEQSESTIVTRSLRPHAPSVYVHPQNTSASDIIVIDWAAIQTPPYSYWAVHNWNQGGEAGGYAGFQQNNGSDESGRRSVHFAIWDPIASRQPIESEYSSSNSLVERFGGEGTGLKVNTTYNWKSNNWYRMALRSWQENGRTMFGQWVKDIKNNTWKLIAIFNYPVPNVSFNYGLSMFQEDWHGNGYDVREARLKNGYSRRLSDKQWSSWNNQRVTGQHGSIYQYEFDGGATSGYVWVKAGGNTQSTLGTGKTFILNQPAQPELGTLEFDIQKVQYENGRLNISWKVSEQGTPQFNGKIDVYDNENMVGHPIFTFNSIKSYQYEVNQFVQLSGKVYAKITLTDIFDKTVEKKIQVLNDSTDIETPSVPAAPSNFQATEITTNRVKLVWDAPTGNQSITAFIIYRGNQEIGRVSGTTTTFIDTGLISNTTYSYTVKAVNSTGIISQSSNIVSAKTKEETGNTTQWDPSKVYTAGTKVQYNGLEYEALWYTQGSRPDTLNGWKLLTEGAVLDWKSDVAYTGGSIVSYQSMKYRAKWWTRGDIPGQMAVWERI